MKIKFYLMLATISVVFIQCSQAQPTWTVGTTTLTEYDLVTGLQIPWEITWGPDDHIWCTERVGRVIRIEPSTGNYTEILDLTDVVTEGGQGEPGLLGLALHPDWANTPIVFIVYNYNSGFSVKERLSAYEWNGTSLINEDILIDNIPGEYIHDGSRLLITPDNKILMTTGDTGDGGDSSQDIEAINGKVLRINLDGSIPSDNPDPNSYVYSYGHRNSQGLCLGPNGIIYESEHGQNSSDEFNIIIPNRNYGWPNVQGACNTAGEITFCENNDVVEPLKEWTPCVAVNGIEYYNHPAIPEWQNSVLLAVLGGLSAQYERLSVLHMSEDGTEVVSEDQYFASFNQRIRDICVNPYTGAVYVAFNGPGYPGEGPNKIKEFVNESYNAVSESKVVTQELNIYPNPATTEINLEVSASLVGGTYQVFANNGDVVSEGKINSESFKIETTKWSAGNYFVKATSAKGIITKTFVIK
jgi:glucose/arabinose dehydrogenase